MEGGGGGEGSMTVKGSESDIILFFNLLFFVESLLVGADFIWCGKNSSKINIHD